MRFSIHLFLSLFLFFVSGCLFSKEQAEQNHTTGNQTSTNEENQPLVLAEGLEIPWSINKQGDTFYISQRTGSIVVIHNKQVEIQQVDLGKDVYTRHEAGLLGFILAPDYEQTGLAYAYHTYQDGEELYNRLVLLRHEGKRWREERVLLDRIPGGRYHHGGRIEIGPDHMLYITTGDATNPELAQKLDSLGGKILRMNLDGSIPEGNPFPNSYIYSYGHRNPQGLAWDDEGNLYSSEHGPSGHDEINRILPGRNYGWPEITGDEEMAGMEKPLFHSGEDTWAPSGMVCFDGKLYVATLRGEALRSFDLTQKVTEKLYTDGGRIRDVLIEDGVLYFVTNNLDGRGLPTEADDRLFSLHLQK